MSLPCNRDPQPYPKALITLSPEARGRLKIVGGFSALESMAQSPKAPAIVFSGVVPVGPCACEPAAGPWARWSWAEQAEDRLSFSILVSYNVPRPCSGCDIATGRLESVRVGPCQATCAGYWTCMLEFRSPCEFARCFSPLHSTLPVRHHHWHSILLVRNPLRMSLSLSELPIRSLCSSAFLRLLQSMYKGTPGP